MYKSSTLCLMSPYFISMRLRWSLLSFDGSHFAKCPANVPPKRVTKIYNRVTTAWLLGYSLKLFFGKSGFPRVRPCVAVRVCVRVYACRVRVCVRVCPCVGAPVGIRGHTHTRLWAYAGTRGDAPVGVRGCARGGGGRACA